eukprot:TRINITY_DN37252_c0_g1_i1.p1 TRINITY_DN37252_c0_g1~~TRINITY_DN37252_c0_g1_i1.p1  ORF type:complete len:148 (-),score=29.05 TRINITY_DN37252_c0_g1_i1:44-460(-)
MTRFTISLEDGCEMVFFAITNAMGGEVFVPKIPSYKITDVAEAIAPECEQKIVGVRPGEKLHEEMITTSDSLNTYDLGKYYAILPQQPVFNIGDFIEKFDAQKVEEGFSYNSGDNTEWETVETLRGLVKRFVDPNFEI